MCTVCQAETASDHQIWVVDFYRSRRAFHQQQGYSFNEAVALARHEMEQMGVTE